MLHNATLARLRAEYLEMPGLRLTLEQAQRLCGIECALCRELLQALVDEKFLCVKSDGAYARLSDVLDVPRPRPAKAELNPENRTHRRTNTGAGLRPE